MTSSSAAAARAPTVGQRRRNLRKYGVAWVTVVCCSMISLSHTA